MPDLIIYREKGGKEITQAVPLVEGFSEHFILVARDSRQTAVRQPSQRSRQEVLTQASNMRLKGKGATSSVYLSIRKMVSIFNI